MSVELTIYESALDYGKGKVVAEVKGNTVIECLDCVVRQQPTLKKAIFDENGKICPGNLIRVNGEYIFSDVITISVKDGDKIEIIKWG